MSELVLPGLDAQNPLAFFAALGLLRVLDDHRKDAAPRLSFRDEGTPIPVFETELSLQQVVSVALKDAKGSAGAHALKLAYDDEGNCVAPDAKGAIADLKPPPARAKSFLEYLTKPKVDRRSVDFGAAFFSDVVQDNAGKTKPTTLHFTSGQQKFLAMVRELRESLEQGHLEEALLGPWKSEDSLPSLSWDSTMNRQYALRAFDPSSEKRGSVAGANWLAVIGLTFYPVQARRGALVTTGVQGDWSNSRFAWPVWSVPCTRQEVACLLRGDARALKAHERRALGVTQVFEAKINRFGQGYGSFSPAAVVPPAAVKGSPRAARR